MSVRFLFGRFGLLDNSRRDTQCVGLLIRSFLGSMLLLRIAHTVRICRAVRPILDCRHLSLFSEVLLKWVCSGKAYIRKGSPLLTLEGAANVCDTKRGANNITDNEGIMTAKKE